MVGDGNEDCVSRAQDGSDRLAIQVVRALADQDFWRTLSGETEISLSHTLDEAADRLRDAMEHKADPRRIPRSQRPGLALALDANRVPGLAFPQVIERFEERHGDWVRGLGFRSVWIVGPATDLVRQLG